MRKVDINRLLEILEKCQDDTAVIQKCLTESKISFLMEAIDEADMEEVINAMRMGREHVDVLKRYLDKQTPEFKDAKNYADSLSKALDTAQGELSKASLDTGEMSSFFGVKVTIPQITKAAIALYTKADNFLAGIAGAILNIKENLVPLIKDADPESSLRSLAGTGGIPTEKDLEKGFHEVLKKSLGGSAYGKLKSFFGQSLSGAEKKIMSTLPEIDPDFLSKTMAGELLDAKVKDFGYDPPKEDDTTLDNLEDNLRDAVDVTDDAVLIDDETPGELPPPLPPEAAEVEIDNAEEELRSAVEDATEDPLPPGAAVMSAIDSWSAGLSKTSQKTLTAAGRLDNLRDTVKKGMETAATAVETEISKAIKAWRSENEETLIKSKRFAKKNFDSLEKMIPQLASFMIKKMEESTGGITKQKVRSYMFKFLDRRFRPSATGLITEDYSLGEMTYYRLNKLAGLK